MRWQRRRGRRPARDLGGARSSTRRPSLGLVLIKNRNLSNRPKAWSWGGQWRVSQIQVWAQR